MLCLFFLYLLSSLRPREGQSPHTNGQERDPATRRGWRREQGAGRRPWLLHCAHSRGPALQFLPWNGLVQTAGPDLVRPMVRAQHKLYGLQTCHESSCRVESVLLTAAWSEPTAEPGASWCPASTCWIGARRREWWTSFSATRTHGEDLWRGHIQCRHLSAAEPWATGVQVLGTTTGSPYPWNTRVPASPSPFFENSFRFLAFWRGQGTQGGAETNPKSLR